MRILFIKYFRKLGLTIPFFIALFICSGANSQINIDKYLDTSTTPQAYIVRFDPMPFPWKMPGNVQVDMNEGINNLQEGNLAPAIANFSAVMINMPKFSPAYYYRGVSHRLSGKIAEAIVDFETALTLNDTLDIANNELGKIAEITGNDTKAEEYYHAALKINPAALSSCLLLGNYYFRHKDLPRAKEQYQRCINIRKAYPPALTMLGLLEIAASGDKKRAKEYFSESIRSDSLNVDAWFWRGLIEAEYQTANALRDWNKAVALSPQNPFYLLMRGFLYIEMDELELAFADLRKALLSNDEPENQFSGKQTILDKKIDLQIAARYLMRKVYGFDDKDRECLKNGFCYLLAGKNAIADNWFGRVRSEDGIVYYFRGLTYEAMGWHNQAFKEFGTAILKDPDFPESYKKHGIYLTEIQDYEGAEKDFTNMINLNPAITVGYKLRGLCLALADKCEKAIPDLTRYINQDSTDVESLRTRAYCFERTSNWNDAAVDFERAWFLKKSEQALLQHALADWNKAVQEEPNDPIINFHLGRLYCIAGRQDLGTRFLKASKEAGYKPAGTYLAAIRKK